MRLVPMSPRTEEAKRRRAILRLLDTHGPMTRGEVQSLHFLRYGPVGPMAALERFGAVRHDPATDTYTITDRGLMRIGRKTTNTTNTGAGVQATAAPAPVTSIEDKTDEMVLFMEGDAGLALHAVRHEADLWTHLNDALHAGMVPPSLLEVPRRRRIQFVEDYLLNWAKQIAGGPCQICGTRTAQPGYDSFSYAYDDPADPTFYTRQAGPSPLCRWCAEYTSAHSLVELREQVGNAVAGTFGVTAGGAGNLKYASPKLVPLASEVSTYSAKPWGHITGNAVLVRAIEMIAEQRTHPARFVRTQAQRDQVRVPGIDTPVHAAPVYSSRGPVTILRSPEPSYRDLVLALERRHMDERTAFLAANPRVHGNRGEEMEWPAADQWTALLAKQHAKEFAVHKAHPNGVDGRPLRPRSRVPGRAFSIG